MATVEGAPAYSETVSDGFTVTSNAETSEQLEKNLVTEKPEAEDPDKVSKAAKELGSRGGKAAAEARKAKGEPEPEAEPGPGKEAEPEKPLGKPRDDPRARMLEATREAAELKRQLATERAERERLAALVRPEGEKPAPVKDPSAKPQEADYDNYSEYVEALTDWKTSQRFGEHEQNAKIQAQAKQRADGIIGAMDRFEKQAQELTKADPKWQEKIPDDVWETLVPSFMLDYGERPTAQNILTDEILTSPVGPRMMLYFAEHLDQFQRIAALPNSRAIAREIAKVEGRLEAATAGISFKSVASQAKDPVRPVTGSPSTTEPDDDDLSFEDFKRREDARELQKRRGIGR